MSDIETRPRDVPEGRKSRLKKTMQSSFDGDTDEDLSGNKTESPVPLKSPRKSPRSRKVLTEEEEPIEEEEKKEPIEEKVVESIAEEEKAKSKSKSKSREKVRVVSPPAAARKKKIKSRTKSPIRETNRESPRKSPKKTTLPVINEEEEELSPDESMQTTEGYQITNSGYPLEQAAKEIYRVVILIFLRNRATFTSEAQNVLMLAGDDAISFYDAKDQVAFSQDDTDLSSKSKNPYELLIYMPAYEGNRRTKKVVDARLLTAVSTLAEELTNNLNEYHAALRLSGALLNKFSSGCECDFVPNDSGNGVFSLENDEDTDDMIIYYNTKEKATKKNRKHNFAILRGYTQRLDEPTPVRVEYEGRNIAALGYLLQEAIWGKDNATTSSRKKIYREQEKRIVNLINKGQLSCTAIQNAIALCAVENDARAKIVGTSGEAKDRLVLRLIQDGYYPKEAGPLIRNSISTANLYRNAKRIGKGV